MMRTLYLVVTTLFWLAVGGLATAGLWPTDPIQAAAPAAASKPVLTLTEVARHATPQDCWMAIDGQVYDVSTYLPQHPAEPALLQAWCGREATQAYRTKTKGRPHSPYADALLPKYRVGPLEPGSPFTPGSK